MKTPLLPRLFLICAAVPLAAMAAPVLRAEDAPAEGKADQPAEVKGDKPAESQVETPTAVEVPAPAEGKADQPAEVTGDKPAESQVETPTAVEVPAPARVKAEAPAGVRVETIAVPNGQPDAAVREAIVKTAMRRQWIVMSQKPGEVVLKLIHRGCEANLTFRIEGSEIQLFSDSYALNKRGERVSSMKVNDGWIKNLRKGIVELLLPGAPAQK